MADNCCPCGPANKNCFCTRMKNVLKFSANGGVFCPFAATGDLVFSPAADFVPTWISDVFTINQNPDQSVRMWLQCISTPPGFPVNGLSPEDIPETNSNEWYQVLLIRESDGLRQGQSIPFNYRTPDTLNGWVGRCTDPFFLIVYINNETCDGVIGHSDVMTFVVTE